MNPNELLKLLCSKVWHLQRSIVDERVHTRALFTGTAQFYPIAAGWLYEEQGQLLFAGELYPARREYRYAIDQDIVAVSFADGRPFYQIDCKHLPLVSFQHQCAQDLYAGELAVRDPRWQMRWRVTGPQKALLIESHYL